jgi:hypothetical protein
MASHSERLDQCALCQRQICRQPVQSVNRHRPQTLQRAGRIDPDEFQVLADMAVASLAGRAMAARVQRPYRHAIARGEPCNAIA